MILLDAVIAFFSCVGIIASVYIILVPFCKRNLTIALFLKNKNCAWVGFVRALFGDVPIFYGEEYDRGSYKN